MRPAGLTAVCIISLCLGVLGGFSLLAGCVGLVAQPFMMDAMQNFMKGMGGAQSPQMQQQLEQQRVVMQETLVVQQRWMPFMILAMVILAVAVVGLIVGAVKGLRLKRMAHRWMIFGMATAMVHALVAGYVGYGSQVESQAIVMRHFNQTVQTSPGMANPAAKAMANNMMQAGTGIGMVIVFGWVLLKCGYYAIAIWYLLTPPIRKLFEGDGSERAIIDALSDRPV